MASLGEDASNEAASGKLQHQQSPSVESHASQQNPVSKVHESQSDQRYSTPTAGPRKVLVGKSDTPNSLQSDRERSISSTVSEKVAARTEIIPAPLSGSEATSPSMMREKVSEDGYHWRKYGQKLVKGNEFVRSYYRCTHPNCQAKKQLDCTHNGQITDTLYFGQHDHPKVPNLPLAVGVVVSIVEDRQKDSPLSVSKDKPSNAHGQTPEQTETKHNAQLSVSASDDVKSPVSQSNRIKDEVDNDYRPALKRRKKDNHDNNATLVNNKPTGESRVVVQTFSEVDIVNDGYRWRKYGQKMVKGSPNPRNYYRCSSSGCPAKKHVERASHDQKLVITTYEGRHDHDMPPSRTVTHNTGTLALNISPTARNGEPGRKLEERDTGCLNMVQHDSGHQSKPNEQLNSKPKPEVGSEKDGQSSLNPESKSIEQQNGESSTKIESTGHVDSQTVLNSGKSAKGTDISKSHEDQSSDQLKGEAGTKLEQKDNSCRDMGEPKFKEREQTPKAEPVKS